MDKLTDEKGNPINVENRLQSLKYFNLYNKKGKLSPQRQAEYARLHKELRDALGLTKEEMDAKIKGWKKPEKPRGKGLKYWEDKQREDDAAFEKDMSDIDSYLQGQGFINDFTSDFGSKYYKRGDETFRLSDHYVPQTPERDYQNKRHNFKPKYTHEVVMKPGRGSYLPHVKGLLDSYKKDLGETMNLQAARKLASKLIAKGLIQEWIPTSQQKRIWNPNNSELDFEPFRPEEGVMNDFSDYMMSEAADWAKKRGPDVSIQEAMTDMLNAPDFQDELDMFDEQTSYWDPKDAARFVIDRRNRIPEMKSFDSQGKLFDPNPR